MRNVRSPILILIPFEVKDGMQQEGNSQPTTTTPATSPSTKRHVSKFPKHFIPCSQISLVLMSLLSVSKVWRFSE